MSTTARSLWRALRSTTPAALRASLPEDSAELAAAACERFERELSPHFVLEDRRVVHFDYTDPTSLDVGVFWTGVSTQTTSLVSALSFGGHVRTRLATSPRDARAGSSPATALEAQSVPEPGRSSRACENPLLGRRERAG